MGNTVETKQDAQAQKKKIPVAVIIVIAVCVAAVLLGIGYFWAANYYKEHFLPGTVLNGIACDNMPAEDVAGLLVSQPLDYELIVTGCDGIRIGTLTAEDAGLRISDPLEGVAAVLAAQNPWIWPAAFFGNSAGSHIVTCTTEFDREKVLKCLDGWETLDVSKMEAPRNAYLSEYIPEKKGYEIIPETQGNTLDVEAVKELVLWAVESGEKELNLEKEGCYVYAEINAKDAGLNDRLEALNTLTGTQITYDWNGNEVVLDGDTIHRWIVDEEKLVGEDGRDTADIELDEEAAAEFVAQQAKNYDTYGKSHKFVTALGETITVRNGGYGWKTDREAETKELLDLIREGKVTKKEPIYSVKAARKGTDDVGNSYVEIDLTNQHLYLYWKGDVVLETDFVSGNMSNGNTTPGGLFGLTYKTTNAVLRGANYETPVNYWMPFNGNIGMHDATWRHQFGGDIYLTDGSHGCINLPLDKAKDIYAYMSTGFPIICYYY